MHGDRRDAQFLAARSTRKRDLPAVGDEDFVEHQLLAAVTR